MKKIFCSVLALSLWQTPAGFAAAKGDGTGRTHSSSGKRRSSAGKHRSGGSHRSTRPSKSNVPRNPN